MSLVKAHSVPPSISDIPGGISALGTGVVHSLLRRHLQGPLPQDVPQEIHHLLLLAPNWVLSSKVSFRLVAPLLPLSSRCML